MYRLFILLVCAVLSAAHSVAEEFKKLSEVERGPIGELAISGVQLTQSGLFVTAVTNAAGRLQILIWANAETTPRHVEEFGPASDVAVAPLLEKRILVAVRDADGRLRVIAFQVAEDGRGLTRLGTEVGPKIQSVEAAGTMGFNFGGVAIAARLDDGQVLTSGAGIKDGKLVIKGGDIFGRADRLAISQSLGPVVAMRDQQGELRLIAISIEGDFEPVRLSTAIGGPIADVDVIADESGTALGNEWVTFSRPPGTVAVMQGKPCNDRLIIEGAVGKLIKWEKERKGLKAPVNRLFERTFEGQGGIALKVAIEPLWSLPGGLRFVTGHSGYGSFCKRKKKDRGKPGIRLMLWKANDSFLTNGSAWLAGRYSDFQMAQIARGPDGARFAIAARTHEGNLRVSVWSVSLQ